MSCVAVCQTIVLFTWKYSWVRMFRMPMIALQFMCGMRASWLSSVCDTASPMVMSWRMTASMVLGSCRKSS